MSVYQTIGFEILDGGISKITLKRPEKLNALNAVMLNELNQALMTIQQDSSIQAVLITGDGKAFCAGADIQQLVQLDAKSGLAFAKEGQTVFNTLAKLGKPSVAAINGVAIGGGCELALAATFRIANNTAQFAQPEVKLGLIPGYGGTQRLLRLVGPARALDLCLTGRFIDAITAEHWGLISEMTFPEELLSRSMHLLKQLTALAPIAISEIIHVIDQGSELTLEASLNLEAERFARCCTTLDKQEGVDAFLTKRQPHFTGK